MFSKDLIKGHNTVIVAVLNWGLGHACRSMPIIDCLHSQGKNVIIASDGIALEVLTKRYPDLDYESLPAYKVRYKSKHLSGIVFRNIPNVARAIFKERKTAQKLVKKYNADLIVSDSRFGFRSGKCRSVIISHQLSMQAESKFIKALMNIPNRGLLNAFDEVWVPDYQDRKLTGTLSKNKKIKNKVFIGPLSTLKKVETAKQYDIAIILSGPESARTNLENTLIHKYQDSNKRVVLVRGTKEGIRTSTPDHWTIYDLATRRDIEHILSSTSQVISRSGYTSIMDYYLLGVPAQLIPTPGQSEQEYLAKHLAGKYGFQIIYSTV
ncbi:MAG: glycosyltransferase [Saprospiraceae bacterium]|nr:glycosyltransferase [Saprospiraceae bacterium]